MTVDLMEVVFVEDKKKNGCTQNSQSFVSLRFRGRREKYVGYFEGILWTSCDDSVMRNIMNMNIKMMVSLL